MRKTISKLKRFEVFKRDNFTCQYCGKKAPDVVLHIDHIIPVSKGGSNEPLNLISSCESCNLGKSNNLLADNVFLEKKRLEIESVSEKKEQREMLARWVRDLSQGELFEIGTDELCLYILNKYQISGGSELKKYLSRLIFKYGIGDVKISIDTSAANYLKDIDDKDDRENFLIKIEGIAKSRDTAKKDPLFPILMKMKNVANKRWRGGADWRAVNLFRDLINEGNTEEMIMQEILLAKSFYSFSREFNYA